MSLEFCLFSWIKLSMWYNISHNNMLVFSSKIIEIEGIKSKIL